MTRLDRTALALALALTLSLSPLAQANEPAVAEPAAEPAAAELPTARSLIDAHVVAIGGREAALANSEGSIKSTMEIVEASMKGDLVLYSRGNDRLLNMTLPAMGETKMGSIGDVFWSIDAMNGPRVLEGKERQQMAEQFDPLYAMRDASLIEMAATTALSDSEGRACYRVEIKWKSGNNTADCYSTENGLLLSTESSATTPMGELKQVSHFSEYTAYGKSKAPKVTKSKLAGMTQLVRIESYEDSPQDPKLFVLPAAIEALVKKAAGSGGTKSEQTQ
jgi:hypothetical protein